MKLLDSNFDAINSYQSRYSIKRAQRIKYGMKGTLVGYGYLTSRLLTFNKLIIMHTTFFIVILSTSSCFCYAGYELFQGFYVTDVNATSDTTTESFLEFILDEKSMTSQPLQNHQNVTTFMQPINKNVSTTSATNTTLLPKISTISKVNRYREKTSTTDQDPIETTSLKTMKFDCPEDESPSNIGPYEIPTQRDIVLFTTTMLLDMFNTYNKEAFYLLRDIRAATKATASVEKTCEGRKTAFKQWVKRVSRQCQQITKTLVQALENQKQEILNLTEVKICNLSDMKTDPIEMSKSLAQQKVSLQFALPGFLRLLNACSLICIKPESASSYRYKPMRHLTDQELIIKHFLTGKNYLELIMDSRHKTIANSN